MQCVGGLKDGTSVCAKILQLFDSEKHPADKTWALLEMDIKYNFNEALRQAAFNVIAGTASSAYDDGNVSPGDAMQSLDALWPFFNYFCAMHDTASTLQYVDHKGQVRHVEGSSGGKQGDPIEMIRFCATIHPTCNLIMALHMQALAVSFAEDGYMDSEIKERLLI